MCLCYRRPWETFFLRFSSVDGSLCELSGNLLEKVFFSWIFRQHTYIHTRLLGYYSFKAQPGRAKQENWWQKEKERLNKTFLLPEKSFLFFIISYICSSFDSLILFLSLFVRLTTSCWWWWRRWRRWIFSASSGFFGVIFSTSARCDSRKDSLVSHKSENYIYFPRPSTCTREWITKRWIKVRKLYERRKKNSLDSVKAFRLWYFGEVLIIYIFRSNSSSNLLQDFIHLSPSFSSLFSTFFFFIAFNSFSIVPHLLCW